MMSGIEAQLSVLRRHLPLKSLSDASERQLTSALGAIRDRINDLELSCSTSGSAELVGLLR